MLLHRLLLENGQNDTDNVHFLPVIATIFYRSTLILTIALCSLVKIFRCGGSDDSIRLRCSDNSDNLTIVIESKGM